VQDDIIYDQNGTKVFLPAGKAGIGAIIISSAKADNLSYFTQPLAVFVYQNVQYKIPLRFAYYNGRIFDFGSGLEEGVFIMPAIMDGPSGQFLDHQGAILYLNKRTINSELTRHYLMGQDNEYVKLAHSEDDLFVSQIKAQGYLQSNEDFVYAGGGIRGPIKIWKITYPENITARPEFLRTSGGYAELDNLTFTKWMILESTK